MKRWQFAAAVLLGGLCLAASIGLLVLARSNLRLQSSIQEQQNRLQSGILGPRGQQIGVSVLQEMAGIAQTNAAMAALLVRHGYQLQTQSVVRAAEAVHATNAPPQGGAK